MVSCKHLKIDMELVKVRRRTVYLCEVDKQGDLAAGPTTCYGMPCGRKSRSCFKFPNIALGDCPLKHGENKNE
jgi:hypothetical protein